MDCRVHLVASCRVSGYLAAAVVPPCSLDAGQGGLDAHVGFQPLRSQHHVYLSMQTRKRRIGPSCVCICVCVCVCVCVYAPCLFRTAIGRKAGRKKQIQMVHGRSRSTLGTNQTSGIPLQRRGKQRKLSLSLFPPGPRANDFFLFVQTTGL